MSDNKPSFDVKVRENILVEVFSRADDAIDCTVNDDLHCIKDSDGILVSCSECMAKHAITAIIGFEPDWDELGDDVRIALVKDGNYTGFVQEIKPPQKRCLDCTSLEGYAR